MGKGKLLCQAGKWAFWCLSSHHLAFLLFNKEREMGGWREEEEDKQGEGIAHLWKCSLQCLCIWQDFKGHGERGPPVLQTSLQKTTGLWANATSTRGVRGITSLNNLFPQKNFIWQNLITFRELVIMHKSVFFHITWLWGLFHLIVLVLQPTPTPLLHVDLPSRKQQSD